MSCKIQTKFAVRDLRIMEDTLKKLGYEIDKRTGAMRVTSHHGYGIDISNEQISCDSMDKKEVDGIKIGYSKALAISTVEKEGALYEIVENENEIIITC